MKGIYLILIITFVLIAPMIESPVLASGRVEHHQVTSKILADAGQSSNRELSVYLPEEYDTSEAAYPVLYLLHGWTGTNRTFLGKGYPNFGGLIGEININEVMDTLIEQKMIRPMLVVLPNVQRSSPPVIPAFRDYLLDEIIPLVDTEYRTIPERSARAIAGHSVGGNDAVLIACSSPNMFSMVIAYAAYFERTPTIDIFQGNDMTLFPLQFWVYVGTNDRYASIPFWNRSLVEVLKAMSLPHIYIEDDGTHYSRIKQRIEESIVFFSENFVFPVTSVEPYNRLTTTWGRTKANR